MSVTRKAALGALWTIITSIGGRAVGVIGTLIMTRFLLPDVIGEISIASILCYSMSWATNWGFGQYAMIKGRGADTAEVTWHVAIAHIGLGIVGIGAMGLLGGMLTPLLGAPHAATYVPGMAVAALIRRFGLVPERVLLREMRFRAVGLAMFFGELSYTAVALTLAANDFGGMSVIYANIVQSCVLVAIPLGAAGFRSWVTPRPLRLERFRDMIRFGLPLAVQGVAHNISRFWDNLAVARCFGETATGVYNMAYNLADVPAIQIGEQIAFVLVPSMAELEPEQRAPAVERAAAMLSLILFPLAAGLGLVAYPLIALILPADKWQDVAPLLAILTSLSVFRPFMYVLSAFMEVQSRTNRLMVLEVIKAILLIGGIFVLSPFGLLVASTAVGISFGATAIAAALIVSREGPSLRKLLLGFVQPLSACVVMAAAVLGTWRGLIVLGITRPAPQLVIEIVVGALAYVVAALVLCRSTSRDLLDVLKQTLKRRRAA